MSESLSPRIARVKRELRGNFDLNFDLELRLGLRAGTSSGNFEELQCVPAPLGYRSCLHNVGILSRQFEGTESEKPNGHQSGNMGEKTEDRYI
jgi:hypothetical protein